MNFPHSVTIGDVVEDDAGLHLTFAAPPAPSTDIPCLGYSQGYADLIEGSRNTVISVSPPAVAGSAPTLSFTRQPFEYILVMEWGRIKAIFRSLELSESNFGEASELRIGRTEGKLDKYPLSHDLMIMDAPVRIGRNYGLLRATPDVGRGSLIYDL